MHLNRAPIKLSGVQFAMATRPSGTANAHHFGCCLLLVRREHAAEGRHHDIEASILERKILDVCLLERDVHALSLGPCAAFCEKALDIVGRCDVREPASRGQRRVAVAGGNVQNLVPGIDIRGFGKLLADDVQRRPDHGVVTGSPGCLLLLFDRREIWRRVGFIGGDWVHLVHFKVPFRLNTVCLKVWSVDD